MLLKRRGVAVFTTLPLTKMLAVLLALVATFIVVSVSGQQRTLVYDVKHGSNVIGKMSVIEKRVDSVVSVALSSKVKAGFIITIAVKDVEDCVFMNGVLCHSKMYREVNGVEKVNKEHSVTNAGYIISYREKKNVLATHPIRYNLMLMYTVEPVNTGMVYSENYERYLSLKKTAEHCYKLQLPDNNYQNYYYRDGICVKVEMHTTFFTAVMILTSNTNS